jgi:hypothetical protein
VAWQHVPWRVEDGPKASFGEEKGRPLAQDPYLGGGGELGTARRGQGKVGSAARVAKADKATLGRAGGRVCAPGRHDARISGWRTTSTVKPRLTAGGTLVSSAERQTTGPSLL